MHPDELLARLTAQQWAGWQVYCRNFPTPIARADINTALIRQSCGNWKDVPKLDKLIQRYGKPQPTKRQSVSELKAAMMDWVHATGGTK